MSLSDYQIKQLASKMSIPLEDVLFKDELESPLEYNKAYIINIEDSMDEQGQPNDGTHWTYLQCNKYKNGKIESIYFDPYGAPPPENVKKVVKETTKQQGLPYTEVDIQSLMNNACGYYCLALGHFINASQYRTNNLYDDVNDFLSLFDDLNKSVDFKKNEYILKHFFRSADPKLRKEIEVLAPTDNIINQDEKGGIDGFKIPVNIAYK
jgi:hypothetical protein